MDCCDNAGGNDAVHHNQNNHHPSSEPTLQPLPNQVHFGPIGGSSLRIPGIHIEFDSADLADSALDALEAAHGKTINQATMKAWHSLSEAVCPDNDSEADSQLVGAAATTYLQAWGIQVQSCSPPVLVPLLQNLRFALRDSEAGGGAQLHPNESSAAVRIDLS